MPAARNRGYVGPLVCASRSVFAPGDRAEFEEHRGQFGIILRQTTLEAYRASRLERTGSPWQSYAYEREIDRAYFYEVQAD